MKYKLKQRKPAAKPGEPSEPNPDGEPEIPEEPGTKPRTRPGKAGRATIG